MKIIISLFLFYCSFSYSMVHLKVDQFEIKKQQAKIFSGIIKAPIFKMSHGFTKFSINEKKSPLDGVIEIKGNDISINSESFMLKTSFDMNVISQKLSLFSVKNTLLKDFEKESFLESELIKIDFNSVKFTGDNFRAKCIKTTIENTDQMTCLNNSVFSMKKAYFNDQYQEATIPDAMVKIGRSIISFNAPTIFLKTDVLSKGLNPRGFCSKKLNNLGIIDFDSFLKGCFKKASFFIDDFVSYNGMGIKRLLRLKNISHNKTDINNLKNVQIEFYNGNFEIFAKIRMLATVNVKLDGKISYNQKKNEIIMDVNKGTVAGVPSRNFILSLIKKFIDSDQIEISASRIIIKLL